IRFLADDALEGRAPGTRGDRLAQAYIASQMEGLGLQPGGDSGTYIQRFPVLSLNVDPSLTVTIASRNQTTTLKYGSEFVGMVGKQQPHIEVRDAEIVFVGYGIVSPEQKWDDYKGTDVRDKVLLFLNDDPPSDDSKFFGGKGRTYYGRWTYKFEIAAQKGAAGAIVIHTRESAGYGWNVVENSWTGEQFELEQRPDAATTLFNGWTSQAATERMLAMAGYSLSDLMKRAARRSFKPIPLGLRLTTSFHTSIKRSATANVIGVLPGSDPVLKNQAIIITAHFDHLGITKPVNGDSINNGALDNATGVSALLEIARMFTSMPERPRRSIVFAAVSAEESGTLGSQFYVENPTFPLARIAANINIDGLNIFGRTRDIVMIGLGKSTIDSTLIAVASWQGRTVKPDQFPEQGSFYRSDQFNFARVGIPCMYLDGGVEYIGKPADYAKQKVDEYIAKHYHQPSDEIHADWDLSGAVEDVQLMFLVAVELANADEMPRWNRGDEFEAARLRMLGN
ncbi:MAG TPA: M28 family metallopeptidase, partial [Bacteroidota bacterium]|nr:M28 family metallopeptidase [Bacteroidota bacterium]